LLCDHPDGRVCKLTVQAVHLLRRVVSILLHEPFAVLGDLGNLSTQRLLTNARACCAIVHGLFNTSQDIAFSLAPLTPSM
jgi:hypothetical protein